jgi:hypothetical protein
MLHFVARLRSQVRYSLSLSKAGVQLALLCPLIGILRVPSSAQYNTGLPTVGNGGAPKDSQALIDAKQFISGTVTDMCGAIAAACGQLHATGYPNGATIDARGFTGDQLCPATTITTMLNSCVTGTGHNGGKLLLGNVNLYIDGPTAHPYYMHGNPVQRGLVTRPVDWAWSSARHYATGDEGAVEIESRWAARRRERLGAYPVVRRRDVS